MAPESESGAKRFNKIEFRKFNLNGVSPSCGSPAFSLPLLVLPLTKGFTAGSASVDDYEDEYDDEYDDNHNDDHGELVILKTILILPFDIGFIPEHDHKYDEDFDDDYGESLIYHILLIKYVPNTPEVFVQYLF